MKLIFLFLTFLSAIIYAGTNSNRVDDVDPLDEFLDKLEQFTIPLASVSSADRSAGRKLALVLLDFNRPKEERQHLLRQLLEIDDISKEEKIYWNTRMNIVFLILDIIEKKAPISGKVILTAAAKMLTDDKFVFGSRSTRKRMFTEELMKIVHIMKERPELMIEMKNIRNDTEIAMFVKQFGF